MAEDKKDTCVLLNHPNIEGWGCHMCRTFNGLQRKECKYCGHKRCDVDLKNKAN